MGDIIVRARHELKELKSNDTKDSEGDILVEKDPIIKLNGYGGDRSNDESQFIPSWGEMNLGTGDDNDEENATNPTTVQLNGHGQECGCGADTSNDGSQSVPSWGEQNLGTGDDNQEESNANPTIRPYEYGVDTNAADKRIERSFFGQAFDGVGNRWNDSLTKETKESNPQSDEEIVAENDVETNEGVKDEEENVTADQPSDPPIDKQNENSDGLLDKSTDSADVIGDADAASDKSSDNIDSIPDTDDKIDDADTDNTTPDNEIDIEPNGDDVKDWGEETSNDEGKDDEEKGWFGNAIDRIVKFFT